MRVMHQYLEIIYQFSPFGILQKIYLNKDIKPIITKKLGINKMASALNANNNMLADDINLAKDQQVVHHCVVNQVHKTDLFSRFDKTIREYT
jgi:hypothetical protein